MRKALFFVAPLALSLALFAARADEPGEWTGTLGCQKCDFVKDTTAKECGAAAKVGDKVYILKGEKVSADFKKGGEWTIKGKIVDEGKAIEVTEMTKK